MRLKAIPKAGLAILIACLLGSCQPLSPTITPLPPTPFLPPSPTHPPEPPLRPEFTAELADFPSAPRYTLRLRVDPASAQVTGQEEIRYTNAETMPLEDLYLRLFPNTPGYGGTMTVTHLLQDDRPVTCESRLAGSALWLPLDPPLAPGEVITLNMDFAVTVPTTTITGYAQLAYLDGVMALANIYPLIPVYDDQGWNVEIARPYGDAVYSDIAFYAVEVSAPPTLTLVASGSCALPEPGLWECAAPLMRDFFLVLGEYRQASQRVERVWINSYFYPDHKEAGLAALRVAADALAAYTDLFGPYPYAELDVVETPTLAGGIEYPGLVVIGDRLYRHRGRLEWVVAHEVAHQWWYGVVGNDQVDQPWLDEALAQYSTLLYHEVAYGSETAADLLEQQFVQVHEGLVASGEDMPVGLPVAAYNPEMYGLVVYGKGPLFFHALRERVGDEKFFDILQTYYRHHQYRIATPESFLTVVKIVTGDPHTDLFEKWIAGTPGQPP